MASPKGAATASAQQRSTQGPLIDDLDEAIDVSAAIEQQLGLFAPAVELLFTIRGPLAVPPK
jgi:hypothetical protein